MSQYTWEKEGNIPSGLKKDWENTNKMVKDLKKGDKIDYLKFKADLYNLLIPLRIQKDEFL